MVFGYDTFNDKRFANNHQSGSDYRIIGTTSIIRGTGADAVIYPQWLPGASTIFQYNPIATSSLGTDVPDAQPVLQRPVAHEPASDAEPRRPLRQEPRRRQRRQRRGERQRVQPAPRRRVGSRGATASGRSRRASSKYVAAINNGIADSSSAAGNPATLQWTYTGPRRSTRTRTPRRSSARRRRFSRCSTGARPIRAATARSARRPARRCPACRCKIPNGLTSPNVLAYAFGVSRQLGNRAVVRADYSFRDYKDFYSQRDRSVRPARSPMRSATWRTWRSSRTPTI